MCVWRRGGGCYCWLVYHRVIVVVFLKLIRYFLATLGAFFWYVIRLVMSETISLRQTRGSPVHSSICEGVWHLQLSAQGKRRIWIFIFICLIILFYFIQVYVVTLDPCIKLCCFPSSPSCFFPCSPSSWPSSVSMCVCIH